MAELKDNFWETSEVEAIARRLRRLAVEGFIHNCGVLGPPVILIQHHGFQLEIKPNGCAEEKFCDESSNGHSDGVAAYAFSLNGKPVCRMSMLGDVELKIKRQPDNMMVDCIACYGLVQVETGSPLCEFYWPKRAEVTE